jgi:transposase
VIGSTRQLRVFVHRTPTNLRNGFDGLFALVKTAMNGEPLSGDLFVFVSKNRKRAKALYWDGTGLCILSKRLEQGRFSAPWKSAGDGPVRMTIAELTLLLEGCDILAWMPLSPPAFSLPSSTTTSLQNGIK